MPKKTRRQKILSEERKRKLVLQFEAPTEKPTPDVVVETVKNDNLTGAPDYFVLDLRKSLFLVAIVITLEIIVYFGTINGLRLN